MYAAGLESVWVSFENIILDKQKKKKQTKHLCVSITEHLNHHRNLRNRSNADEDNHA